MSDFQTITNGVKDKMEKALQNLKNELVKLRTGRATPSLVDHVRVDYYGTPTPLKQMAQIAVPDAKTLQISCWDQSAIPLVEKAIVAANIGLTPQVDGKLIRLNIPALSEDRRKEIVKTVKKLGEDCKIALRGVRRDANELVKADKAASEDAQKNHQDQIQKITDEYVTQTDSVVEAKSKEVLTV
jgi:ribosome recycling factor